MNPKTLEILESMIAHARSGHEIIPAFFQPRFGISNSVSAAIRAGIKAGILEASGKDGCGKPKYRLATPAATHSGTEAVN